jgi:hypothetical protein
VYEAIEESQRQHMAKLLGLPQDPVPPLRIKWCHLSP